MIFQQVEVISENRQVVIHGLSKIDFLSKWQSITNGQLENILEIKSVKINGR